VSGPGASGALTDLQTLRLDLPASGWYEVSVSGGGVPETVTDRGAYRMALMELGTAPEQVGGNVVPGDSVVAEAIDEPGDWDEYTLTALPNQDLGVVFQSTASAYFPHLVVFDSASGDSLAGTVAQGLRLAGPFRMPLSGRVRVAVFEPPSVDLRMCHDATCGGIFGYVGGYRFEVIPINRAPENVPASYAAGDTVRGEAISPAGDIDEYTSTGTPGDTLTVWYRLTADPVPSGSLIALDIIDPATGMVLVGAGKSLIGSSVQFHQWGRVVVPSGGSYVIRVHAVAAFGEGSVGTAPYEFLVTR
jgi:hypothetical protein